MSNSSEKKVEDWIDRLNDMISCCEACQPHDEGEIYIVQGDEYEMRDFLGDREVPEALWEDVAAGLSCGMCSNQLGIDSTIGVIFHSDVVAPERKGEWVVEDHPRVLDFTKWLEEHPYLGSSHEVGKEILDTIAKYPRTNLSEGLWWRAQCIRSGRSPSVQRMGPNPNPPKTEGRYNHHGQRVFYLASVAEAAVTEAGDCSDGKIWLQKFRVRGFEDILDLRTQRSEQHFGDETVPLIAAGIVWTQATMAPADVDSEWKPQYFLPRYIADCAQSQGFRGVVFDSKRHSATNLVMFQWTDEEVTPEGEPSLNAEEE